MNLFQTLARREIMSSNKSDGRFDETADSLILLEKTKKILDGMTKKENHDKRVVIPIGVIDSEENIRSEIELNEGFYALVESIKKLGLLQPLVVIPHKGKIKLVSGHRRLKAVKEAGWENVPVIVKHFDYSKDFTLAQLVENINREELTPIDHSEAILVLKERGKYTNKEVGRIVGHHEKYINSLTHIANMPPEAKAYARSKNIGITTLREIVKTREGKNPQKVLTLLKQAVESKNSLISMKGKSVKSSNRASSVPSPVREWFQCRDFGGSKTSRTRLERLGRIVYLMDQTERQTAVELINSLPSHEGADGSLVETNN